MRAFNHAMLAGGAATALLAGVATAEFALAPIHESVAAETAPCLDTTSPAATPRATQADLSGRFQASPPAAVVPMRASRPPEPPMDLDGGPRSYADEDAQRADDDPVQEAAQEALPGARDVELDRDPTIPIVNPAVDNPPPVTPG